MKRRLRILVVLLLLGFVTTVAVAWLCAGVADLSQASAVVAGSGDWQVTVTRAAGAMQIVSTRRLASWSPGQATGPPDTPGAGDYATAWAPATSAGQPEWLELEFADAVVPRFVDVHETYKPGAMTRLTLVKDDDTEIDVLPDGQDPAPPGPRAVSRVEVPLTLDGAPTPKVRRIKIYQGRREVPGWNEIDAVGLTDGQGNTQWATAARASSWYGQSSASPTATGSAAAALVPAWTGLSRPTPAWVSRTVNEEVRVIDARGWPLVALWAEGAAPAVNSPTAFSSGTLTLSGSSIYSSGSTIALHSYNPTTGPRMSVVPWRPVWGGLLADTAIFALCWGVIFVVAVLPRRFVRELSRVKRGCCIGCGYDLGYDFVAGCPECGWRRTQPQAENPTSRNLSR